jgi:Leucine-rich repeat (LRR) protein
MKTLCVIFGLFFSGFSVAQTLFTKAQLDTLPEFKSLETALQQPEKVYKLTLKGDKLTEIPKEIARLKNLQILVLKRNKIDSLVFDFSSTPYLQVLDVSRNNLTYISPDIEQLTHLKKLLLGENNLTSLPPTIGNLKELVFLDLWGNEITDLPESLNDIPTLKKIDMRVIQLNYQQQEELQNRFPNIEIIFSAGCNCN